MIDVDGGSIPSSPVSKSAVPRAFCRAAEVGQCHIQPLEHTQNEVLAAN